MPKKAPIAINFQPGDPVKQTHGSMEGYVHEVLMVESKPVYMVRYIDPSTGDKDCRAFEDGQIEDHPEGDAAIERLMTAVPEPEPDYGDNPTPPGSVIP